MSEKIYTIPVNEAFDEVSEDHGRGCPFCRLYNKLEKIETDNILGASMMEPDIRIKTNEKGFCPDHFEQLLSAKNRLGLALILESHLNQLRSEVGDKGLSALISGVGKAAPKRLNKLDSDCHLCERIDGSFAKMLSNAVLLWTEENAFRSKVRDIPYICLPHLRMWLETASKELKKGYPDFYKEVTKNTFEYFDSLRADISWFCKKFDYRYDSEPWGNSKDSVERAEKFLCADLHKTVK